MLILSVYGHLYTIFPTSRCFCDTRAWLARVNEIFIAILRCVYFIIDIPQNALELILNGCLRVLEAYSPLNDNYYNSLERFRLILRPKTGGNKLSRNKLPKKI